MVDEVRIEAAEYEDNEHMLKQIFYDKDEQFEGVQNQFTNNEIENIKLEAKKSKRTFFQQVHHKHQQDKATQKKLSLNKNS